MRRHVTTASDKELLQFVATQVAAAIERKQAEIQLRHMARHDPLAGLPSRTLFNAHVDMVGRGVMFSLRDHTPCSDR